MTISNSLLLWLAKLKKVPHLNYSYIKPTTDTSIPGARCLHHVDASVKHILFWNHHLLFYFEIIICETYFVCAISFYFCLYLILYVYV